jgi:predicted membrane-bound spermidine synthase
MDVPETPAHKHAVRVAVACLVFFVSGAASLIFEALWFHQTGLAFGSSVWASSLVLSGFMCGMALGSFLCARHATRWGSPFQIYARLELIVGVSGVALVAVLPSVGRFLFPVADALTDQPFLLNALRFGGAFLLLLAPSTAMGMTLPVLVRGLGSTPRGFGSAFALLYGVNTLGAMLGVLVTEWFLVAMLGIRGASFVAGGLSVFAAAITVRFLQTDLAIVPALPASQEQSWRGGRLVVAAFLSGLALLALEVVWLRFLMLFLNDTSMAFASVLAIVLLGIALGGILASFWLARSEHADRFAPMVALSAGALGVAGVVIYPSYLQRYHAFDQTAMSILAVAAPLVLPVSLASGALFSLLGAGLRRVTSSDATAAGRLLLFNTLGAGTGSMLAGFVLLPLLGMERSLFGLFVLYGLVGLLLAVGRELSATLRAVSLVGFVAALACFPFGDVRAIYVSSSAGRWMRSGDSIVEVREGLTATIVHIRHTRDGLAIFDQLATNAYSMSVNDFAARRYMDLFVYLPVAIHPRVRRAVLIGYGVGNTAEAMVRTRELESIDVVDISRDMLELSRRVKPQRGIEPLDDPRVHVHVEDGRYFLASTSARFDLITGEPPPPMMAGVSNLYSREYFELVHDRLAEGGIATYWLPMMNISAATGRSIVAGFCAAFDDCSLWHGSARNFMLMGTRGAHGPVSAERFGQQFADLGLREELTAVGFDDPSQLGALFIGDAIYLTKLTRNAPPISDDWPKRIAQEGTLEARDALIWQWRDTKAARQRFENSDFIARTWPEPLRSTTQRQFENQRMINDLLFPEQTPVRQLEVLHQVLTGTALRLPVLLLLGSDFDVQHALARLPPARRDAPQWLLHRAAGHLADREFKAALALLARTPDRLLPFPDLTKYVDYVVQRQAAAPPAEAALPKP